MQVCHDLAVRDLGVTRWVRAGASGSSAVGAAPGAFRRDPAWAPTLIESLRRTAADDGTCLSREGLLDGGTLYASDDDRVVHRSCGPDHILWCFRQIPRARPDENSGVILTRARGKRVFEARDRTIVGEAHAALTPLIGGPLARFAEPSPMDLAPRARRVLACLLEGDTDKQAAARLLMSTHTVNQYTKAIFRHFGVRSRAELLARWVRRHLGGGFPWSG